MDLWTYWCAFAHKNSKYLKVLKVFKMVIIYHVKARDPVGSKKSMEVDVFVCIT